MIPDMHKIIIHHNKFKRKIPENEFSEKLKRLKVTKKAVNELQNEDRLFYEFFMTLDLNKEQKKQCKSLSGELDVISEQYEQ
jgi:hypothetical protein